MFGFKEIDTHGLREWMDGDQEFLLVDVRSPAEMAQGVIEGATLITLHLLPVKMNELSRSKPIVFYCQSGARSAQACAYLARQGWDEVYNLRGGIMAWVGNGQTLSAPGRLEMM